jgi:hypothetical protein
MKGINRRDETRLLNMQFQLGKYILAQYLKKHQETGQLEMDFTVKIRQQNDKQLTFTISPVEQ